MRKWLERLLREEEGQGLVEYGLILALIAVAVVAMVSGLGQKLLTTFTKVDTELGTALETAPDDN